ncbi:MAG: class I SAM-dependent methyltransferase, partial [Bdellovibrionales bacterium]|nr:class I SAM-dependent methyltransferase [Bdellovibrionales bacterium]
FDKYYYYHKSVQSADVDVEFFKKTYEEIQGKLPTTFREDFCGTFALSCEWVKLRDNHTAIGVDLDPEPIAYGKSHYLPKLDAKQQARVKLMEANVLDPKLPGADVIAACNFSYFIFKDRKTLKEYFANVFKTLPDDGIFIMDCFGGSQCYEPNEEETEHDGFSYFWDQDSYDPVTNEAQFYIHFKPKGQKKVKKAFSYDWRMWSIPELKDILAEVGFTQTQVYWEGTDEDGEGDGEFAPVEHGEDCESWVAYLVSKKS